jgi:hypothetical protein
MRPKAPLRARDALAQLQLDHVRIRRLLRQYDRVRLTDEISREGKAEIVDDLCDALSLLALLDEEIFYPVVRPALGGNASAQAAFFDHVLLGRLIAQLDELPPGDHACDAVVADIGDRVVPCINAAEASLFEAVRNTGVDTLTLGMQMALRRREHRAQLPLRVLGSASVAGSHSLAALRWPQAGGLAPAQGNAEP